MGAAMTSDARKRAEEKRQPEPDVYLVQTPAGFTESFDAKTVDTLVKLGLIEHQRDGHVVSDGRGNGIGPLHHFYRRHDEVPPPISLRDARDRIETFLAALPDSALPKPDRIERDGGEVLAWFSSHGYHLGSSLRGEERNPGGVYRERGSWEAVVGEAVRRLDLAHEAGELR
jgi:hypothetical protein